MRDPGNHDDKPVGRRHFFREGLRELLKPLATALDPLVEAAKQLGDLEKLVPTSGASTASSPAPSIRKIPLNLPLRPPGALDEMKFRETCSRCGECVRVCPAQCIKIDATGVRGSGAPYINADEMACVVCDSLACMTVCPTGALLPTVRNMIDMGTAVWHADTCVRSKGEDCTICIDRCPIGTFAIDLLDGKVNVKEQGCVGCGVCQHECPTDPKSIVVIPKSIPLRV